MKIIDGQPKFSLQELGEILDSIELSNGPPPSCLQDLKAYVERNARKDIESLLYHFNHHGVLGLSVPQIETIQLHRYTNNLMNEKERKDYESLMGVLSSAAR